MTDTPEQPATPESRHVWLAIPAYTGCIHLGTMRSVISDLLALTDQGIKVTIFDESGNAMIGDCRGLIVSKFLESDATDLVFIDSDVTWEAGTIAKLVNYPVDMVAAMYPQRRDPINFCVGLPTHGGEMWADKETGLLEVDTVPFGMVRLTRGMLQLMVANYPDTQFYCEQGPNLRVHDLFGPYRRGKYKFGEDYSFCLRWKDIGGKVWCDPEITMGHIGYKTFVGKFGDWMRERAGNGDTG